MKLKGKKVSIQGILDMQIDGRCTYMYSCTCHNDIVAIRLEGVITRINCVDVNIINDKMLAAEYRELPRVSKLAHNAKADYEAPKEYCLGTGHVKFFYDKGEYLRNRFENEIVPELQRRGFNLKYTTYRMHPEGMNNNWIPNEQAKEINIKRINERNKNA